jgi:beta-glucosidase-like glycosyl hydrolase
MDKKKKIAQLIIARLDARDINKNSSYYESLVRRGIGGFVIFNGSLKQVKNGIKRLQAIADYPLFIASDLEQGLGQQIEGGTLFPPAMAISHAINTKDKRDVKLLRTCIRIISQEAKAVGINVILAPVLDVNTNPYNPIIGTRAFSENPRKVAWFGNEFIKGIQAQGLIACAKHFPGHGDTREDSHIKLPVIKADIKRLNRVELYPFKQAIEAGIRMIMIGHLKVPALDPRHPSSLSSRIIKELLKDKMGFKGLIITDAMNMQAVSGREHRSEQESCLRALNSGADLLLHPQNPEDVIDYLGSRWDEIMAVVESAFQRVTRAKESLFRSLQSGLTISQIGTKSYWQIAYELTQRAITIKNKLTKFREDPVILVIDDDDSRAGDVFVKKIKSCYKGSRSIYIDNSYRHDEKDVLRHVSDKVIIVAVFSKVSAWKGRVFLSRRLQNLLKKVVTASKYCVIAGFCYPYILRDIEADAVIEAFDGSRLAQEAVGRVLCDP